MKSVAQAPTQMDNSRSQKEPDIRQRVCDTCGRKNDGDKKEDENQFFKGQEQIRVAGEKDYKHLNRYATKKSFLSSLLDFTLMVAGAAHLYTVIDTGRDGNSYYWYLVVLICISLLLQVILFIFLLTLAVTKLCRTGKNPKCVVYNNITVVVTIVIVIIDLTITGLSLVERES